MKFVIHAIKAKNVEEFYDINFILNQYVFLFIKLIYKYEISRQYFGEIFQKLEINYNFSLCLIHETILIKKRKIFLNKSYKNKTRCDPPEISYDSSKSPWHYARKCMENVWRIATRNGQIFGRIFQTMGINISHSLNVMNLGLFERGESTLSL